MTADLRWLWARLNANYWFYPALFAAGAALLAYSLTWLDRDGHAQWLDQGKWIIPARPSGATNMLTVIAGSMIGVASTVFSITIAAVAYASGTYGPRLLTNFMEDKGNQLSLATFIGTFVYALSVLRTVRAEDESAGNAADAASSTLPGFVPQLSLLVAYLLMALSVAVLVYFLNHVPSGIRINTVLQRIGTRLLEGIADAYPEQGDEDGSPHTPRGHALCALRPGYVQLIDFDSLARSACKADVEISLLVRTGDFVHPGVALAEITGDPPDDELARAIRSQFNLGPSRTPEQDPQFLIDELVEIGLRALSPGINDPFTAITALHWLGAATTDLGNRRLDRSIGNPDDDDDPRLRVFPLADDFPHFVARGFGTMRSALATSPPAAQVAFDTLAKVARTIGSPARIAVLRDEAARLIAQTRLALDGPDLVLVEEAFTSFNRMASPDP